MTHDQHDAYALADKLMIYGEVQQIGTTDEVLNNPANVFVAQSFGVLWRAREEGATST